jgi:hypothetical protein
LKPAIETFGSCVLLAMLIVAVCRDVRAKFREAQIRVGIFQAKP